MIEKAITPPFYILVDKKLRKNQSVNQETLNRCSRWLVNNLNPDEDVFPLDDVFDSDFVEDLKVTFVDKNYFTKHNVY